MAKKIIKINNKEVIIKTRGELPPPSKIVRHKKSKALQRKKKTTRDYLKEEQLWKNYLK